MKYKTPTKNKKPKESSPSPSEGVSAAADGVEFTQTESIVFIERNLSLPKNLSLVKIARELRQNNILAEVVFWNHVKSKQIFGLDFDRQRVIGNYIVDFYIKRIGVVIEIDGSTHNDKIKYDKMRDDYLMSNGIEVLHYRDTDVLKNMNGVIVHLKNYILEKHTE
jgi:very-short-patch-repair endonuclease